MPRMTIDPGPLSCFEGEGTRVGRRAHPSQGRCHAPLKPRRSTHFDARRAAQLTAATKKDLWSELTGRPRILTLGNFVEWSGMSSTASGSWARSRVAKEKIE